MVGVMWLWSHQGGFRFDLGKRLERFITFRNKSQFERESQRLAQRSAEAVVAQRAKYSSIEGASEAILERLSHATDIGTLYDAAVAFGLCGKADRAAETFARIAAEPQHTARDQALAADAVVLAKDVADLTMFRLAIQHRVIASRHELRLPALNDSLLFAESQDAGAG